jgi:DNA adenine methylase
LSGRFNVPFGGSTKRTIFDGENILAVGQALANATLTSGSFEAAVSSARRGDFVYLDPPYYPLNNTSKFTSYHERGFLTAEQVRLRKIVDDLDARGCYVMLSNSHTPFIRDLYRNYAQHIVLANRAVNCKADGRGKIKEYVILNYNL